MNWAAVFSKMNIFNALSFALAALQLTDVVNLIPDQYNGALAAFTALVNLVLRTWFTGRPVTVFAAKNQGVPLSLIKGTPASIKDA